MAATLQENKMKLYATVSSERASKGRGGNKRLKIHLTAQNDSGERVPFDQLTLEREEDFFVLRSDALGKEIARQYAADHDPRTCENSVPCYDCAMTERGTHQKAIDATRKLTKTQKGIR